MSKSRHQLSTFSSTMSGFIGDIEISKIRESKSYGGERAQIEELARSVKQKGLLQPILVRTMDGYFEIVAGNRRFSACEALGWKKIACHVIELDDKEAFEVSLIENIQRKRLNAIDEANAFKAYVSDCGWGGVSDLAIKIGKSVSYITKRIKLLNLPTDVLDSIKNSKLSASVAEELASLNDKGEQSMLANLVLDRSLSLRRVRKLVNRINEKEVDYGHYHAKDHIDHMRLAERSFDKTITTIRIAMNSLTEIIESIEQDWILYEILMQHKNMLHSQIDILLKERRKLFT